jgi:hypothetical protein
MNDISQTDIPIDAGSVNLPEASPNQALTPDAPVKQDAAPKEPVKVSAREAIENAAKKVDAAEAKAQSEPKARAEDGKFAPKPEVAAQPQQPTAVQEPTPQVAQPERAASKYEAPARFSEAAKTEWQRAPESVQAEVARVLKENEDGITKYKASHENWDKIRQYDDVAKQNGREGIHESLKQITEMENTFARNPIEGFQKVAQHFNLNLEAVAAHILGQNPNQHVAQAHEQVKALQNEVAMLKQQLEAPNAVAKFREEFGALEFDGIADDIAELLETGVAHDLKSAATMARMLNRRSGAQTTNDAGAQTAGNMSGAQTAANVTAQTSTLTQTPPNPAANKSVTGAPGPANTSIANAKPSGRSIQEAIRNAAAQVGA